MLHEWWGIDDHIRSVCDRFATEGYVALAPDLFHGETTEQPDEAQQKMMAMNMEEAEKEMRGAVGYDRRASPNAPATWERSGSPSGAGSRSGPRP